ncbi:MAG: ABC-type transport auxiliary lipoprotein family protein [Pseudomonadota bacterium]|nr:ABC-type transport auxiliary lipoprotein family protein [Pseudomonadota bacterium]
MSDPIIFPPLPGRAGTLARLVLAAALTLPLAACSVLSRTAEDTTALYAPDPRVPPDPTWPDVQFQLTVASPSSARMIDSLRIAVRPSPNELQVYKGASWAKRPSEMVEDALLRALEDSGKIPAVARQGSGVSADYKLVMDLRRFESVYLQAGSPPTATVEVNAKLLHARDQQVIATRTFTQTRPAASTEVPQVVAAFEQALGTLTRDLSGWILTTGHAHEQQAHATP